MPGPQLNQLKFDQCCKNCFADLKDVQELGRILHGLVAASPFMILFGSDPVDVAVSVGSQDWDLWQSATNSVPKIVRAKCQQLCAFELLNHPGGDLARFWREMYNSFG